MGTLQLQQKRGDEQWNPLSPFNENMQKIEDAFNSLENNSIAVCHATVVDDLIIAITRNNPDGEVLRFFAPTTYKEGMAFKVDGKFATARTVGGNSLPNGAFAVGMWVFCIYENDVLTMYVSDATGGGGSSINKKDIIDLMYPVGHILITMNESDPNVLYEGTTWERFAQGKTLFGYDSEVAYFNELGKEGGQYEKVYEHTHDITGLFAGNNTSSRSMDGGTEAQNVITYNRFESSSTAPSVTLRQPAYGHNFWQNGTTNFGVNTRESAISRVGFADIYGELGEATGSLNTLSPYITTNIWKRTA